jgi:hypothetical protein
MRCYWMRTRTTRWLMMMCLTRWALEMSNQYRLFVYIPMRTPQLANITSALSLRPPLSRVTQTVPPRPSQRLSVCPTQCIERR